MPLLSMMSSERATYLPTLSPFPNGDMLNSSKTILSSRLSFDARRCRRSLVQPHLGILHLAQQPESVQRLPQHRAAFLDVRFVAFRLLAQLAQPVDKRG